MEDSRTVLYKQSDVVHGCLPTASGLAGLWNVEDRNAFPLHVDLIREET